MWPVVRAATEESLHASLGPLIASYCPAFLSSLSFSTLSLGDIPPVISGRHSCHLRFSLSLTCSLLAAGVRVIRSSDKDVEDGASSAEEGELLLDLDLKMAGNPDIALEAKGHLPGVSVVAKLANLRCELPWCPR